MESGPLKHHKLLGMANWKRAKESRVNQAEDGGVGADAEGEGENSDCGEARILPEQTGSEAQIP